VDSGDLHTETFSNSQGWMAVRVTHIPTAVFADRSRSDDLKSPVQAQRECIDEIKRVLASSESSRPPITSEPSSPSSHDPSPVSRTEFESLSARVARLERQIGFDAGA
jgi:hypothetical protein